MTLEQHKEAPLGVKSPLGSYLKGEVRLQKLLQLLSFFSELDTTERLHLHFSLSCIGEGNGTPLQHSCLENPMGGGAWWAAVHGVAKSWKQLSNFTFTFHFHALEKEMATHSSVLAWRIPGMGCLVGCCLWGHTESDMAEMT